MDDSSEGERFAEIRKCCSIIDHGPPTRYLLKPDTDQTDDTSSYRTITYGERDSLVTDKVLKTLLLVGETGSGKTKLINTIINHLLKVQREDQIWFEITDEKTRKSVVQSQTPQLTVYRFYLPESPVHLNIIDTPGFGDTESDETDQQIGKKLLNLLNLSVIDKLDLVCFVINSALTRLSDRDKRILDAVQSLFSSDMETNIVLLLTFSDGNKPTSLLTAVREAKVQCAVDEKDQPVYFLFNNCQSEPIQENQVVQKHSWDLSVKGCTELFQYMEIKPRNLKMTRLVLETREELEECIDKIQSCVKQMEEKEKELKQTEDHLDQIRKHAEENNHFESEVEVKYREKVDIDLDCGDEAMTCSVCQTNCQFFSNSWGSWIRRKTIVKEEKCKCSGCPSGKDHIRKAKMYVTKTKMEKKVNEELKKKYEEETKSVENGVKSLSEELQELKEKKVKLVIEAFDCVKSLERMALNTDSLSSLQHLHFLIHHLRDIKEDGKAERLKRIKNRAGEEKHRALKYITR